MSNYTASSSRELWNEGRVVGLSAHEIYVRQHMIEDPTTPPASEREWLAASLGSGASVLVHVGQTTGGDQDHHIVEIRLPEDGQYRTNLCAANTIVASYFNGDAEEIPGTQVASRVTSYGRLISNDSSSYPQGEVSDAATLPKKTVTDWDDAQLDSLASYMRVLDGVVLQPGTWSKYYKSYTFDGETYVGTNGQGVNVIEREHDTPIILDAVGEPKSDFIPDMSGCPVIRLHVKGRIDTPFWMLLTGFTMRSVVVGSSKYETGCLATDNPENGDYLGPENYPWANKIIFQVPTAAIRYDSLYTRKIASGSTKTVQDSAIIDFRDTDPATYYKSNFSDTAVTVNVDKFITMRDGTAVLTAYQRSSKYAPALFGTFVDSTGSKKLNPIDTVAPRTLKLFHAESGATAKDFENSIPRNYALIRDGSTYKLTQINGSGTVVPVADATVESSSGIYSVKHQHGNSIVRSVAITNASGTMLPMDGSGGTVQDDLITWSDLLKYLAGNKKIDVLGDELRSFRQTIIDFDADGDPGKQYVIEITEEGKIQFVEFNAVVGTVENRGTKDLPIYVQKMSIGDMGDFRSVSLQSQTGNLLGLTGKNGVLEYAGGVDQAGISWQYMLQALGQDKLIDALGPTLRNWRTALNEMSDPNVYNVALDDNGLPHLVPTAEFPEFMQETVLLDVVGTRVFSRMILDVFGYVKHTQLVDGTVVKTANMMATLSTFSGDQAFSESNRICQRFKVNGGYVNQWQNILKKLAIVAGVATDANGLPTKGGLSRCVLFNSGGRPIWSSNSYSMGAPISPVMVTAYIPYDVEDDDGIIYINDYASSYGWEGYAGCVSSCAYQGSLVISSKNIAGSSIPSSGPYTQYK